MRGFRLDGYGVFFDVEVPSLDGTLTWSLRTLDQNDLGLQSALAVLKTRINPTDIDLQQALKRIELQVGPATLAGLTVPVPSQARGPERDGLGGRPGAIVWPASRRPRPRRQPHPRCPRRRPTRSSRTRTRRTAPR